MHALLLTIGSAGDVHPFIAIGLALRRRGHRVTLITNPYFGAAAERAGLHVVPLGTVDEFATALQNPKVWGRTGHVLLFKLILGGLRRAHDAVVGQLVAGEPTVVVASSLGWGPASPRTTSASRWPPSTWPPASSAARSTRRGCPACSCPGGCR